MSDIKQNEPLNVHANKIWSKGLGWFAPELLLLREVMSYSKQTVI